MHVYNVSVTPFSYSEDFTGENAVLTSDKLTVSFRAHTIFRVRPDRVKEFMEQYTTLGDSKDQVQFAFANYLKEPLRTEIRVAVAHYDAFALNENIGKINNEVTAWAEARVKDTPFQVMNVVVGNIQFPTVVTQAVTAKLAAAQELETRSTQVAIARKDAEKRVVEAEGIAKATQIIQQRLTPLYIQHEAIEAQKLMVNSQNHTTIYIPVGPMGVPIVNTVGAGEPKP
jgi:regulator of protease activity HflC (stomatin/prohibitin superfamily)